MFSNMYIFLQINHRKLRGRDKAENKITGGSATQSCRAVTFKSGSYQDPGTVSRCSIAIQIIRLAAIFFKSRNGRDLVSGIYIQSANALLRYKVYNALLRQRSCQQFLSYGCEVDEHYFQRRLQILEVLSHELLEEKAEHEKGMVCSYRHPCICW